MLLEVFLRLGRAAAILDCNGQVLFLNERAEALAGDGFVVARQHLRAARPADQSALQAAIDKACAGERLVEPILLQRSKTTVPLLVRAMPMDGAAVGEKAILLLFTDPLSTGGASVVRLLQLLGLSPAEARIAVLVGTGAPPKRAAEELSISENTVRSVLKTVYDKLIISRQSELAQIVARLEGL
jgi:DNA-binding CsgD family transcriptional regulator